MKKNRLAVVSVIIILLASLILAGACSSTPSPTAAPKVVPSSTAPPSVAPSSAAPSPTQAASPKPSVTTVAPSPTPSAASFKPVKIRFSSVQAKTVSAGIRCQWMMDEITKRTGGAVTWETYWASALAPGNAHLDLIQKGSVDMIDTGAYWTTQLPTMSLTFAWPFAPSDPVITTKAVRQLHGEFPEIAASFAKYNTKVVALTPFAYYTILSKMPFASLQDLNGKKIALVGGYFGEWMKPSGLVPVNMQATDRYSALQTGLIDANLLTISSQLAYSLHEQAKYLSSIEVGTFVVEGVLINNDFFNKLEPALQKLLLDVGIESETYLANLQIKERDGAVEKMKAAGVTVVPFPSEDLVKWSNAAPDVPARVAAEMTTAGMRGWDITKRYQEITTQLGWKWARKWAVKP